jgi:two-component system chemotaxis response regulator CheY
LPRYFPDEEGISLTSNVITNINKREPIGIGKGGTPYRILVVDDSTVMRKIVTQILRSEAFDVVAEGSNGEEGIELYKEHRPDLVTMDVNMPIMDGLTALKKIIEVDAAARIVMLTSESEQKMVLEAIQSGAKNYVVKPPDRTVLLEKVKASLTK